MEPLRPERVVAALSAWHGHTVYIHIEVNPGAYWRNGQGVLKASHVRGEGPFRVFLEFGGTSNGLIQVDNLTHMSVEDDMVICTGYDEHNRIARTIEISTKPFAV